MKKKNLNIKKIIIYEKSLLIIFKYMKKKEIKKVFYYNRTL